MRKSSGSERREWFPWLLALFHLLFGITMGATSIYCEHLGTQETTIGVRPEATIAAIIGGVIATVSLPIVVGAMGRKKPLAALSLVYGPTMAMILVVSYHREAIVAAEVGVAVLLVLSVICHQYALPHDRVNREWRCSECGYDLTGNTSGTCPECGATTVAKAASS